MVTFMPRRARVVLDGVPLHIIQRGNNRSVTFFADDDYVFYLEQLRELCVEHDVRLHAFCLMTNHVHLLLTPVIGSTISHLMKRLGQCYVQRINRLYQRSGTLRKKGTAEKGDRPLYPALTLLSYPLNGCDGDFYASSCACCAGRYATAHYPAW